MTKGDNILKLGIFLSLGITIFFCMALDRKGVFLTRANGTKESVSNRFLVVPNNSVYLNDSAEIRYVTWFSKSRTVPRKQCTMQHRIERMRSQCSKTGHNLTLEQVAVMIEQRKLNTLIYVDDKHKVIYCVTPKSASTTFRHLLLKSTGRQINVSLPLHDQFHDVGLKFLCDDYSAEEISYRLQNYLKLIVVRHPMDRLVSAHNHRFVQDWDFPLHLPNFLNLTNKYFNRSFNTSPENTMSFDQFIQLLIKEPLRFRDGHWKTVTESCHPCELKFNYVIRLEELQDDLPVLLERLGNSADDLSILPQYGRLRTISNKLQNTTALFKRMKKEVIEKLMEKYGPDMEQLGYTWDHEKGANCAVVSEDGKCC